MSDFLQLEQHLEYLLAIANEVNKKTAPANKRSEPVTWVTTW